jgi:hypothetical protein
MHDPGDWWHDKIDSIFDISAILFLNLYSMFW